jgi:hypothetical protein
MLELTQAILLWAQACMTISPGFMLQPNWKGRGGSRVDHQHPQQLNFHDQQPRLTPPPATPPPLHKGSMAVRPGCQGCSTPLHLPTPHPPAFPPPPCGVIGVASRQAGAQKEHHNILAAHALPPSMAPPPPVI